MGNQVDLYSRWKDHHTLIVLHLLTLCCFYFQSMEVSIASFVFICVNQNFWGGMRTVITHQINLLTSPYNRATALSFGGLFQNIMTVSLAVLTEIIADRWNFQLEILS